MTMFQLWWFNNNVSLYLISRNLRAATQTESIQKYITALLAHTHTNTHIYSKLQSLKSWKQSAETYCVVCSSVFWVLCDRRNMHLMFNGRRIAKKNKNNIYFAQLCVTKALSMISSLAPRSRCSVNTVHFILTRSNYYFSWFADMLKNCFSGIMFSKLFRALGSAKTKKTGKINERTIFLRLCFFLKWVTHCSSKRIFLILYFSVLLLFCVNIAKCCGMLSYLRIRHNKSVSYSKALRMDRMVIRFEDTCHRQSRCDQKHYQKQ